MRGLKQDIIVLIVIAAIVASFTDAWIETFFLVLCLGAKVVASFTDAWIETLQTEIQLGCICRIFYRCVD